MQRLPAAVGLPSLFNIGPNISKLKVLWVATFAFLLSFTSISHSQNVSQQSVTKQSITQPSAIVGPRVDGEDGRFLAEITVNSVEEVAQALRRAEQLFEQGAVDAETGPATFILYGPEVSVFLKDNYQSNKAIVGLAARLSAFKVVDIRVCEIRLGLMGVDESAIQPFVNTVPFGPREVDRLLKEENYSYF